MRARWTHEAHARARRAPPIATRARAATRSSSTLTRAAAPCLVVARISRFASRAHKRSARTRPSSATAHHPIARARTSSRIRTDVMRAVFAWRSARLDRTRSRRPRVPTTVLRRDASHTGSHRVACTRQGQWRPARRTEPRPHPPTAAV
jgi:hypothetical protein